MGCGRFGRCTHCPVAGFCSVHKRFTAAQIAEFRTVTRWRCGRPPRVPTGHRRSGRCGRLNGGIKRSLTLSLPVPASPSGPRSTWLHAWPRSIPNKHIECLDAEVCPCSTMYMIHPAYLLDVLERLEAGEQRTKSWSRRRSRGRPHGARAHAFHHSMNPTSCSLLVKGKRNGISPSRRVLRAHPKV